MKKRVLEVWIKEKSSGLMIPCYGEHLEITTEYIILSDYSSAAEYPIKSFEVVEVLLEEKK